MLDQNTDRMWYVIGAVIVGAALIFLMNGTFPSLFANVGTTFEDKVEQTTEMTDGIMPVARVNPNLIVDAGQYEDLNYPARHIQQYALEEPLVEGNTYTFTFKGKLGEGKTSITLGAKEMELNRTAHYQIGSLKKVAPDTYQLTFVYQATIDGYTAYGDSLSTFINPHFDETTGISLMEWVKLEKGAKGTAYVR